jgi:hypothetical protein
MISSYNNSEIASVPKTSRQRMTLNLRAIKYTPTNINATTSTNATPSGAAYDVCRYKPNADNSNKSHRTSIQISRSALSTPALCFRGSQKNKKKIANKIK